MAITTSPRPGIGAILKKWNTTLGQWDEITNVIALAWDGPSRNVITYFPLNTSDEYMRKLQGVLDAQNITATILYTTDEFYRLKADEETRGNVDYQIVLPNGEGIEWDGFVSELPLTIGSGDVMSGDVVFAIDGKADFLSAASTSPS